MTTSLLGPLLYKDHLSARTPFKDNFTICISHSDRIERSNLDGNYREVIVQTAVHPFAVTVYSHYIYWTDWTLGGVYRAEKYTGANQRVMIQGLPKRPMDIHVVSQQRQTACK